MSGSPKHFHERSYVIFREHCSNHARDNGYLTQVSRRCPLEDLAKLRGPLNISRRHSLGISRRGRPTGSCWFLNVFQVNKWINQNFKIFKISRESPTVHLETLASLNYNNPSGSYAFPSFPDPWISYSPGCSKTNSVFIPLIFYSFHDPEYRKGTETLWVSEYS